MQILEPKSIFEELLHGQDINGSTPVHYAAHHGGTSVSCVMNDLRMHNKLIQCYMSRI